MPDGSLIADVAAMLDLPSSQAQEIKLEPCTTGGNNRVYVATLDARKVVVKQYFRHPADKRDRLQAERAFLDYATRAGITSVPRVIACDVERGIGVYEFIEGRKLAAGEIDSASVREAAAFFLSLNDVACRTSARVLPPASEACFNISDHFAIVDSRLAKFDHVAANDDTGRAAHHFIGELRVRWEAIKGEIGRADQARAFEADVPERCVSPSDFGFHNAIARPAGPLCFLDFEYAGWDDPARMICDFFLQVAVPVPPEFLPAMVTALAPLFGAPRVLAERVARLMLLYHVKWCCLLMGDLHPVTQSRRRFAGLSVDAGYIDGQLARAWSRYRDRRPIDSAQTFLETFS